MANRMTLHELTSLLLQQNDCTKAMADDFCRQYFAVIKEFLFRDGIVKVKGLGTFKLMAVNERESIDVTSGQRIEISAHSRITFTPDKALAVRINKPFESFEVVTMDDEQEEAPKTQGEEQMKESNTPKVDNSFVEIHSVYLGNDAPSEELENETPEEEIASVALTEENNEVQVHESDMTENPQEETEAESAAAFVSEGAEEYEAEYEEESGSKTWVWILSIIFGILLLFGSYFVGYYRLLGETDVVRLLEPEIKVGTVKTKTVPMKKDTVRAEKDSVAASLKADSLQKEAEKKKAQEDIALAEKYEQIPNGQYLIVGTMEEHVVRVGDNLLQLSYKKYGDASCAQYVILYNKIANPDIIPLGYKLKLPRLIKR